MSDFIYCLNSSTIRPTPILDKIRIAGEVGYAAIELVKQALTGSGITIDDLDARWSDDVAASMVAKWIGSPLRRHAPLHAVVAHNDQMAAAARRALVAAADQLGRPELRRVPVLGGDGLPEIGRPWVDDGTLTATVCVTLPGRPAVEQLAQHWRHGSALPAMTRLSVSSYPPLLALAPTRP